jgi:hypothetical protein
MSRGRSRYYRYAIMSNSGFGSLIIRKNDLEMVIPQKYITNSGSVYQNIQKLIDKNDLKALTEKGINIKTLKI